MTLRGWVRISGWEVGGKERIQLEEYKPAEAPTLTLQEREQGAQPFGCAPRLKAQRPPLGATGGREVQVGLDFLSLIW